MARVGVCFAVLLASASACVAEPTFYRDVLPILQNRCQECHRPGEAGPMPLLTYKNARPWAAAIREAVLQHKMPPWHADSPHGFFRNDRRLTDREIDTLATWAKTGAKEGDPNEAPKPRQFVSGWTIGKPDVVFDLGTDFHVPAQGTIEYTYFVVPTQFAEDRWVEKIELRPSNRAVVHHAVLFARPPGSKFFQGVPFRTAFVPKQETPPERQSDTGEGMLWALTDTPHEVVSIYVPGGDAYQVRPGQARLIKAGTDLIFQMHYTANGKEAVDRTQVGIVFAKRPPAERVVNTAVLNPRIRIPPNADNHRLEARFTIQDNITVESVFPHMHVRGKAFEFTARLPNGETKTLVRVPRYDFNWQHTYYFADPISLPKGTELKCVAWYDNSANNPANPDPKAEVFWGDQSWEEMLMGIFDFSIPADRDPLTVAIPAKAETAATRR